MDIDTVAGLDLVPDDFQEGEHEKLDEDIRAIFPVITLGNAHAALFDIVEQLGHRTLQKYRGRSECRALMNSNPSIYDMLLTGSKNSYKNVRLLKLLRPAPVSNGRRRTTSAAEHGWEDDYVGDAAHALWNHVGEWFRKDPERGYYAKYSAIVQSSGMGKSRAVDEMSKIRFVIPVNLRSPQSSGYPPTDQPAYNYLTKSASQWDAFIRSCSFLHALFVRTANVLEDFKGCPAAGQFRNYMKEGMVHEGHGKPRTEFYKAVEIEAKAVYYTTYLEYFCDDQLSPSDNKVDHLLRGQGFPLRRAFRKLCEAPGVGDKSAPEGRKKDAAYPAVVLAFDEVHSLTELINHSWSRFGEIRRAVRGLKEDSLFTLFLSTSGTLFSVTPTPKDDWSSRMIYSADVMLPFYELGFDQLAVRVKSSQKLSLSRVASEEHFSSYGRPLWRAYSQAPDKNTITEFAVQKLLGGTAAGQTLSLNQQLACLAHRVPIEFLSAHYVSQMSVSEAEKEQVNSHMRVILRVDNSLETMVTASPSEPILSDAAYSLMKSKSGFNIPQVLRTILDGFAVHKGELGELIVALLFIIARDEAVTYPDSPHIGKQRWCSITKLLESFFCIPPSPSENHVNVVTSCGWRFTPEGVESLKSSLADTFKDSKVYFTHFIKVHQHALVKVEFLMGLMVRGAAMLCGNNQPAVDGIIPFLLKGDEIRRDNIGVIMFQVKNDVEYTLTPKVDLLQKMNPRNFGMISPSADIPVIRFFFALAANTPTLQLVHHNASDRVANSYSTYDFWVSGLSPDLLVPVKDDPAAWNDILQASHRWEKIYSGGGSLSTKLRKNMNPGAGVGKEFWENWFEVEE